jgi:hypothetical protein
MPNDVIEKHSSESVFGFDILKIKKFMHDKVPHENRVGYLEFIEKELAQIMPFIQATLNASHFDPVYKALMIEIEYLKKEAEKENDKHQKSEAHLQQTINGDKFTAEKAIREANGFPTFEDKKKHLESEYIHIIDMKKIYGNFVEKNDPDETTRGFNLMKFYEYKSEAEKLHLAIKQCDAQIENENSKKAPPSKAKAVEKIVWKGTKEQFAATISVLEEKHCIDKFECYKKFTEHFDWLNPMTHKIESMNNKELSSALGHIPETRTKVHDLTKELKKKIAK